MNTSDLTKSVDRQNQSFCTKKFETPAGQIENYYVCGQTRFTSADIWSLQKQRKGFPVTSLTSILK